METTAEHYARLNRSGNPCAYFGELEDWLVVLGQHRDSDALARSNFKVACEQFEEIDPDCYHVESASHWAVGWVETLVIDPNNAKAITLAEDIQRALEDYPILDEDDFSNLEFNEYLESWDSWGRSEYVRRLVAELESREVYYVAELLANCDIDEVVESARQLVNWEYSGDDINIDGLVDCTRDESIVAELLKLVSIPPRFDPKQTELFDVGPERTIALEDIESHLKR